MKLMGKIELRYVFSERIMSRLGIIIAFGINLHVEIVFAEALARSSLRIGCDR